MTSRLTEDSGQWKMPRRYNAEIRAYTLQWYDTVGVIYGIV